MREILFKATRTDNGEWVEGYVGWKGKDTEFEECNIMQSTLDTNCSDIVYPFYFTDIRVDPATICQYSGKQIFQNENTATKQPVWPVKVWENDLIAIYTITYDDDDTPVRTRIAVVKVEWDDNYKMLFAQCVEGDMDTIARECDISYLDGSNDYPFTFWMEYMENSHSQWWEWEVIGNAYDKEEEQ